MVFLKLDEHCLIPCVHCYQREAYPILIVGQQLLFVVVVVAVWSDSTMKAMRDSFRSYAELVSVAVGSFVLERDPPEYVVILVSVASRLHRAHPLATRQRSGSLLAGVCRGSTAQLADDVSTTRMFLFRSEPLVLLLLLLYLL